MSNKIKHVYFDSILVEFNLVYPTFLNLHKGDQTHKIILDDGKIDISIDKL